MKFNKDELKKQVKEIEDQSLLLKNNRKSLMEEISNIELEEKKQTLHYATISTPVDWKTIISLDENGQPLPGALDYIRNHLGEFAENIQINGRFHHSKQLAFHLKLNPKVDTSVFLKKFFPILNALDPIIWKDTEETLVALPVLDKKNGNNGSYSMILNSQKLARIARTEGNKLDFKTKFLSIKVTLDWIKNNL